MAYFERATAPDGAPHGAITFARHGVSQMPDLTEATMDLFCPLTAHVDGLIEEADGLLQVDFANRNIGGGVLTHGAVQVLPRLPPGPPCGGNTRRAGGDSHDDLPRAAHSVPAW